MSLSKPTCLLLVAAAFLPSPPAAAQPAPQPAGQRVPWEDFDRVLASILRASHDNFAVLEGARIENRRRDWFFEAKAFLPEATYCRIFSQGGSVFCCEWDGRGLSGSNLLFDKLGSRLGAALTVEWSKTAKHSKLRKEVVYAGARKPVVHLILESSPVQVFVLVLPTGAAKEGFTGKIPSIDSFVHP